jgi:hypothetical protein
MCTNIVERCDVRAASRSARGWFAVDQVAVSYDHPVHALEDHAVLVDFARALGPVDERVPVELSLASARALAETLLAVVERAEAFEGEPVPTPTG